jgi:hypothetical protein
MDLLAVGSRLGLGRPSPTRHAQATGLAASSSSRRRVGAIRTGDAPKPRHGPCTAAGANAAAERQYVWNENRSSWIPVGEDSRRQGLWVSQRPRIFVRTSDPLAAEIARQASFAADSVELGDLLSTEADAIVSAGNSVGHMNGGVDLRIRDKFSAGRLEERVRQTIVDRYHGELQIGEAFAIRTRPPDLPMQANEPSGLSLPRP